MTNNTEINNALASNYLLVSHSVSKFTGRKTDRKVGDAVISAANATSSAGTFNKNILVGADGELKAANSAYDAIRGYIYNHSLPYSNATSGPLKGDRLVSTAQSMEFIAEVDKLAQEATKRRDEFVAVYDQRVNQAIANLGGLANTDDYMDSSAVSAAFGFRIDYEPVPEAADFSRMSIPAELADKFAESVRKKQELVMQNALGDLKKRILSELERAAKALGNRFDGSSKTLKQSPISGTMISNIRTLVNILKDASFAENPQLDKLVTAIETHICSTTVEKLRANPAHAKDVSLKAKKIINAVDSIEWF